MDEFLKVVYRGYVVNDEAAEAEKYREFFQPMLNKIKETVSDKVYGQIEDLFMNGVCASNEFYAIKGMNLALDVIQKKYVPTF